MLSNLATSLDRRPAKRWNARIAPAPASGHTTTVAQRYIVSSITTRSALAALIPQWTALFYAAATPNPFAHPLWLTAWARHHIAAQDIRVVTVRGDDGAVVGVAPFYRRRYSFGPGLVAHALQLMGASPFELLTELPQVLIQPGLERPVLRAIMHHLAAQAGDWDWIEIMLAPDQGWFEPQWLPQDGLDRGIFVLHKATRPCVMLPLPAQWEELRAGLKRNVRESLRHGANSLTREGHVWQVSTPTDAATFDQHLDSLLRLHQARAAVAGKVRHADYFTQRSTRDFLRDAAGCMFSAGHLTPYILRINGAPAAGRLLLHANGTTYFSFAGFDSRWWRYNVATTLMAACLRHTIERGDTLANLSVGPDVAKLRWSERLDLYQEFCVVGSRRRSRLIFALYWHARAGALLHREGRRYKTRKD